jgi:hypothetical protein
MQVSRLRFLDATRGVALVAALLSHLGGVLLRLPADDGARIALGRLGMVASPTFVLISGMLMGFMAATLSAADFRRRRTTFVDRGLFLLLVAHPLICAALAKAEGTFQWSLSTDAIGVCFIAGALLIEHSTARQRLELALLGFLLSWGIALGWMPHGSMQHAIKEAIFGDLHPTAFPYGTFPIIPWLSFYLASTVLGERLAYLIQVGHIRTAARKLWALSALAVGLSVALKFGAAGLAALMPAESDQAYLLQEVFRISRKYPPGVAYLLFHGGAGLACLAGFLELETRRLLVWPVAQVARWGETSLPIFIAHFYLYWLVLYQLGPVHPSVALIYFLATGLVFVLLSRVWRMRKCNRFLTVGWPHVVAYSRVIRGSDSPLTPAAETSAHG